MQRKVDRVEKRNFCAKSLHYKYICAIKHSVQIKFSSKKKIYEIVLKACSLVQCTFSAKNVHSVQRKYSIIYLCFIFRIQNVQWQCSGCSVQWLCSAVQWLCSDVAVQCSGCSVQWQCSAVAVQCSGSAVQCSGCSVQCSGCAVQWQCIAVAVQCSGSAVHSVAVQCSECAVQWLCYAVSVTATVNIFNP